MKMIKRKGDNSTHAPLVLRELDFNEMSAVSGGDGSANTPQPADSSSDSNSEKIKRFNVE